MMAVTDDSDDKLDFPKFGMVQNMIRTADENVKNYNFVKTFFI